MKEDKYRSYVGRREDVEMKVFYTPEHAGHAPTSFYAWGQFSDWTADPPARAENILARLTAEGHEVLEPRQHGLEPVGAVHTPQYIEFLREVWPQWRSAGEAARQTGLVADRKDVYPLIFPVRGVDARYPRSILGRAGYHSSDLWMPIGERTYEAARAAANLATEAADVLLGGDQVAYALCRPSGHHADRHRGGGNCCFNNAAIAAQHLRRRFDRVAVIDLDVHHGNGTQSIFYDRDDVLFVSIHCDPDDCYPYFVGYADETGEGPGRGYNLNLPLPRSAGDDAFLSAVETACGRVSSFEPGALVISLGVDGHEEDLTHEFRVTLEGFRRAGRSVAKLSAPTAIIQEGGYNLETIGQCVAAFLAGFESRL
jgi:acetoin utilization deacetylase AcuC-like enzyme